MDMDKNKTMAISVLVVVVFGAALWYYYYSKNQKASVLDAAMQGVLPSIGTNPLTNKPDINPTSKTNPFTSVKTNPFQ
ncbi:MAG: hypothetical protein Q8P23_02980 [bacterium]|nr:hypothetical protein [bacterium]